MTAQMTWPEKELKATNDHEHAPKRPPCVLAFWHRPVFSSGTHGHGDCYDVEGKPCENTDAPLCRPDQDMPYCSPLEEVIRRSPPTRCCTRRAPRSSWPGTTITSRCSGADRQRLARQGARHTFLSSLEPVVDRSIRRAARIAGAMMSGTSIATRLSASCGSISTPIVTAGSFLPSQGPAISFKVGDETIDNDTCIARPSTCGPGRDQARDGLPLGGRPTGTAHSLCH